MSKTEISFGSRTRKGHYNLLNKIRYPIEEYENYFHLINPGHHNVDPIPLPKVKII